MQDSAHIIFSIAVLIMSVVVHETSHGHVANVLGDPTARLAGRLSLNPIKHLDPIGSFLVPIVLAISGNPVFGWAKPVPFNPYNLRAGKWGPALVAAAGPLSNLLVAILFGVITRIAIGLDIASPTFTMLTNYIVGINILLAVVNLIPIPPIDGSKILFALLPPRFSEIEEFFNRYGIFVVIGILFVGWRFIGPVVGSVTSAIYNIIL